MRHSFLYCAYSFLLIFSGFPTFVATKPRIRTGIGFFTLQILVAFHGSHAPTKFHTRHECETHDACGRSRCTRPTHVLIIFFRWFQTIARAVNALPLYLSSSGSGNCQTQNQQKH